MHIFTIIYSFILLFFFHPLYNNYTSLMNNSHAVLYYIWCILLTFSLCKLFLELSKFKKSIYILAGSFFVGLALPYHQNYPLCSKLHVLIPIICIIITFLFLALLIRIKQKSEPLKAHKLYQWYFYCLSIIFMFIIFFSQINGLIEITILLSIYFIIYLLQHS